MMLSTFNLDAIDLSDHTEWWITRYTMSLGIYVIQAKPYAGVAGSLWVKDPVNGVRCRVMSEAWPTEELAVRDAENKVKKRIRTMQKQIENLQKKQIKVKRTHAKG